MFQTSAAVNPPTKDDWEQRRSISRRELSKSSYPGNPKDYVTDFKETKCTESNYLGRGMCPWHDVDQRRDGTGMTDRNEVREWFQEEDDVKGIATIRMDFNCADETFHGQF